MEISCSQWEGSASTWSALILFLLRFGGWGRIFFPFKFLMGSHQVPTMFTRFSMCSSRVFPVAPCFNPICFAQSPPLLSYIAAPKGEAPHNSIESSTLESLHNFNFIFCDGLINMLLVFLPSNNALGPGCFQNMGPLGATWGRQLFGNALILRHSPKCKIHPTLKRSRCKNSHLF